MIKAVRITSFLAFTGKKVVRVTTILFPDISSVEYHGISSQVTEDSSIKYIYTSQWIYKAPIQYKDIVLPV